LSATPKEQPSGKLWGGRFDRAPDELFYQFQRSFAFDRRLLPYELVVDRAWAHALESAGILTVEELLRESLVDHRDWGIGVTRAKISAIDEGNLHRVCPAR